MCPSVVVYAVDHIVAPKSPSHNKRKICIWIFALNNYVSYTLVCVHFIVCSMYVSSCSTPSFSSPANSAIPSGVVVSALASINEVNLRRVRLVLSWATDGRILFRYVTNQPPNANSAFDPSGVGK